MVGMLATSVGSAMQAAAAIFAPGTIAKGPSSRAEMAVKQATLSRKPKYPTDALLPGKLKREGEDLH